MILDTTLLIDLQREIIRGVPGAGHLFLERNPDELLYVSVVTLGEFFEGVAEEKRELGEKFVAGFEVLIPNSVTAWIYGRESRRLRQSGERIGDNDLWIGATALERGDSVVTRNVEHFKRIHGLKVVGY